MRNRRHLPLLNNMALALKDRRVLIPAPLGGNLRLLSGMMGADFHPFLQADAADVAYAAPVNADEVALLLGPPGKRRVAFVSVHNGVVQQGNSSFRRQCGRPWLFRPA